MDVSWMIVRWEGSPDMWARMQRRMQNSTRGSASIASVHDSERQCLRLHQLDVIIVNALRSRVLLILLKRMELAAFSGNSFDIITSFGSDGQRSCWQDDYSNNPT